jgi:hypothetical protein
MLCHPRVSGDLLELDSRLRGNDGVIKPNMWRFNPKFGEKHATKSYVT